MKQQILSKYSTTIRRPICSAIIVSLLMVFGLSISMSGTALAKDPSKQEQQTQIREMAKETLTKLYKEQPAAKKAIEASTGYAVFSNFGLKILMFGSGTGKGLVVDKAAKKDTFMKMIEAQVGVGIGVKKFRQVWVFKSKAV